MQGPVFKTGVRRFVSRVGSTPISFRHLARKVAWQYGPGAWGYRIVKFPAATPRLYCCSVRDFSIIALASSVRPRANSVLPSR